MNSEDNLMLSVSKPMYSAFTFLYCAGVVAANIDLDSPKLNIRINRLNLFRCLLGEKITSPRSLMKNKAIFRLILTLTKHRNRLQLQYKKYAGELSNE